MLRTLFALRKYWQTIFSGIIWQQTKMSRDQVSPLYSTFFEKVGSFSADPETPCID
jgi:hypothetical protein